MAVSRIDEAGLNVTQYGNRNLIINGAMTVAQRGTSSTSNGYATVDRIKLSTSGSQLAFTQEQASEGPEGFAKSWKFTVTTPETTLDAGDIVYWKYAVEDYDLQQLSFGTSEAKTITLSFWVRSSVTGDYAFTAWQMDGNKGYNVVYTINSANTWEYKTITISGNTADVINADSGIGFDLYFTLSSGSTYSSNSSMRDNWATYTSAGFAYGQTADVMTTNGATWQITGLQLEVGDTATPFEHRSYGDELARCRRYFQIYGGGGSSYVTFYHAGSYNSNSAAGVFKLDSTMRTAPTFSTIGSFQASNYVTQSVSSFTGVTSYDGNLVLIGIQGAGSNFINGGMLRIRADNDTTARFKFDAEL